MRRSFLELLFSGEYENDWIKQGADLLSRALHSPFTEGEEQDFALTRRELRRDPYWAAGIALANNVQSLTEHQQTLLSYAEWYLLYCWVKAPEIVVRGSHDPKEDTPLPPEVHNLLTFSWQTKSRRAHHLLFEVITGGGYTSSGQFAKHATILETYAYISLRLGTFLEPSETIQFWEEQDELLEHRYPVGIFFGLLCLDIEKATDRIAGLVLPKSLAKGLYEFLFIGLAQAYAKSAEESRQFLRRRLWSKSMKRILNHYFKKFYPGNGQITEPLPWPEVGLPDGEGGQQ